jgi:hypothetical protein
MKDNAPELKFEDEDFDEITKEEEEDAVADAQLLDEDEAEDEFIQGSIDADDLRVGFGATIRGQEVDVDEDTEGDETIEIDDTEPLTELEMADDDDEVHGDIIELGLDEALTTGRTIVKATEID